jgi:LemA protein
MGNQLDEVNGPVNDAGRDVHVIDKQIAVKVGWGSTLFEVLLWVFGIIPGAIFLGMKVQAGSYLRSLEQKIQHDASTIDNYLEQRVIILKNAAKLLDKAVNLDQDTFTKIAGLRSGALSSDEARNQMNQKLEEVSKKINIAFEAYPTLQAHEEIQKVMQQNDYLQREITAAREVYNDSVYQWNHDIQQWPTKMIVAAKAGYTTRIPFTASKEVKEAARGTFF